MTRSISRLACPACLDTTMDKVALGPNGALEIDHCRGCGGIWLDLGEVQQLRALPEGAVSETVEPPSGPLRTRCHGCDATLNRTEEQCPVCGWGNTLACPACASGMGVGSHAGLRLDFCRSCKGIWFDNHELEATWSAQFDRALRKRRLSKSHFTTAGDGAAHSLFDALLAPGSHAARTAAHASAETTSQAPAALAALPETASDAASEAAGGVLEVVLNAVAAVFDGL